MSWPIGIVAHPGRPERDRLEQRVERPLRRRQRAERRRVRPLEHEQGEHPAHDEGDGHHDDQLRLEREADPAALRRRGRRRSRRRGRRARSAPRAARARAGRSRSRRGCRKSAHQVEARVVERRDRVEHARTRRPSPRRRSGSRRRPPSAIAPIPSAMSVNDRHAPQDGAHRSEVAGAGGLLGEDPVAERRPPADDEQQEQRRAGHEPEPAQLDHHEDRDLAEAGSSGPRCRRRRGP